MMRVKKINRVNTEDMLKKFITTVIQNGKFSRSSFNPNLVDIMKERRSVRDYTDEMIPQDVIEDIIAMGNWAPSAKNQQPLKYYVCTDEEIMMKISSECLKKINTSGDSKLKNIFFNAPVTIFISWHEGAEGYENLDVGLAMQNMQLYAYSVGLGSCCIGYSRYGEEYIRKIFGMEDEEMYSCALTLVGYPNPEKNLKAPPRKNAFVEYFDDDDL